MYHLYTPISISHTCSNPHKLILNLHHGHHSPQRSMPFGRQIHFTPPNSPPSSPFPHLHRPFPLMALPAFGGGGADGNAGPGDGGGGDGGSFDGAGFDSEGEEPVPGSLIAWYLVLLDRHPVPTKSATAALITFFGDLFCQLVIEKSSKVDLKRIGTFTMLGLLLVGPTLHFWYLALSKLVSGSGPMKAGVRLMLDQFVFSPIFIGIFFSVLLTLEGRPSDIIPKLRQDWPTSVVTNWKIWIPFQFLNFLIVPQQLQVLAANVISLAWNVYLSFATHTNVVPSLDKELVSDVHPKH